MSGSVASPNRQFRESPNSKIPSTPSSALNIKLIRSSAARPLLYSKANKEMMQRLADVIQDSNTAHKGSTKGLLPVEAAYSVMKRVTQAAGEPLLPTGMSTFNKLQSLRTEPALKVLKAQTWKTFFSEGGSTHHGSSRSSSPQLNLRGGSLLRPLSAQSQASRDSLAATHHSHSRSNPHHQQQQSARGHSAGSSRGKHDRRHLSENVQQSVLQGVADGLLGRIVGLWHQLKIPAAEQDFHRRQLFMSSHHNNHKKGDREGLAHCRELATLLEGLLQHKELTKTVLREVKYREVVLSRCLDVLRALHRKQHSLHQHNNSNHDHHQREGLFWKEELLLTLSELRLASIKVIRAIATWRKQLWRPQPFHCRGVNYLLKMATDTAVLQSEGMRNLLSLLPLTLLDLQGILFFSAEEMHAAVVGTIMHSQSAPAMLQADQQHDHSNPLATKISAFRSEVPVAEIKAVVAFVLDEPRLQNALLMERSALQSKGVFIPLLRLPVVSSDGKRSQQQERQSPEPKTAEPPIIQLNRPPSMKAFKEKKLQQQRYEKQDQAEDEDEEEKRQQTVESKGEGEAYGEDFDDQN